ncbi:B12-binding domain-containing radical SAM protein [Rhizobium sp. C1]|uniref:B12-binding domain-containing radical SAM protein n=1 Tax=Rhizobium sp. C1 TaxID=1349799 RepID=UPI001E43E7CB|nr:radical SAM protein [Rhizobium sp. C1]MCD2178875.1 radical SAM protein [Rhizobium sp. C1]
MTDTCKRSRGRKLLLVVLPYIVDAKRNTDTKVKSVRSFLAFPYGVLTIASHIRKASNGLHDAEILDLNIASPLSEAERLRQALGQGSIDVVGFSMSYDISFGWLKRLSEMVRAEFPLLVQVVGGPAVTTGYKDMIEEGVSLDAFCFSEGEAGLLKLLDTPDMLSAFESDPWIRNAPEGLARPRPHAVTEDLDRVIDVDYELVDVPAYSMREAFSPFVKYSSSSKQFFLVTSRGCPFKCNFCAEPSFHGASMRYASVDLIIDHVRKLVDNYGLNVLTIYDDQLLLNRDRAKDLFRKLAQFNIRVEMPNGVTMSYIDEEMAYLMRRAGVDTIFLAIESGSKRVLKEIIFKPIAFSRIKPTVELLQANGIFTCAFFVIGLPGETDAEREETRQFILDTGFDWAFFNYATPLRGSALFEQCKREGWLAPEHQRIGAIDMTDYVINAPGIDKAALKRFLFDLNLEANFVKNRNMREGNYELAATTFKEVINRHEGQPFAHYFLADAYTGMGLEHQRLAAAHYRRFRELIEADPEWADHAERYGLDISRTLARPVMEGINAIA